MQYLIIKTIIRKERYFRTLNILSFLIISSIIVFAQVDMKKNGYIQLRIKLVDETGLPTKGIRVDANIFTVDGRWEGKSDLKMFKIDDFFSYDNKFCNVITVDFVSKDYREKRISFWYEPLPNAKPQPKTLKGDIHVYEETIVLQKFGKIGKMENYDEFLGFNPQKGNKVIDLSMMAKDGKRGKSIRLYNFNDPDQMTNIPRLYLKQIPRKEIIAVKPGDRIRRPLDKDVCLCLDDKTTNCGFILVDHKMAANRAYNQYKTEGKSDKNLENFTVESSDSISEDMLYEMNEAPKKGYKKELRIPDDYWEHRYPICFYIKMNGLYGKGYILGTGPILYVDTTKEITARIKFTLELDGSCNVTFKGWYQ